MNLLISLIKFLLMLIVYAINLHVLRSTSPHAILDAYLEAPLSADLAVTAGALLIVLLFISNKNDLIKAFYLVSILFCLPAVLSYAKFDWFSLLLLGRFDLEFQTTLYEPELAFWCALVLIGCLVISFINMFQDQANDYSERGIEAREINALLMRQGAHFVFLIALLTGFATLFFDAVEAFESAMEEIVLFFMDDPVLIGFAGIICLLILSIIVIAGSRSVYRQETRE